MSKEAEGGVSATTHVDDAALSAHLKGVDGDVATKLVDVNEVTSFTAAENRSVLLRIDRALLPWMFVSYAIQFVDKAILGSSAQFGILQDLDLATPVYVHGVKSLSLTKYSYCSLIFYWGFLAGCIPAAYLAQHFPIGRFCGVAIMVWGALTMVTAGVTTYHGLLAQRFFLGFVEGAVPAAFSIIVAIWYRKHEQPLRQAFWFAASGLGGIVGSIAIYGIGHIHGALPQWKYQFLILGTITIVWGGAVALFLPDNPTEAKFLNDAQKVVAIERMRAGQTGVENKHFKIYQVKEALTDVKNWCYVLILLCIQATNGATGGFVTIIARSLGMDAFQSVLFVGALGAVTLIALPTAGVICLFVKNMRLYIAGFAMLPMIAGTLMLWKSSWVNKGVPVAGFIMLAFNTLPTLMILALLSANTGGFTKKAFTSAMVWAAYCITNGWAPLLVKPQEAEEHFPTLCIPLVSLLAVAFATVVCLRLYLMAENRRRDRIAPVNEISKAQTAFVDLTDKENPNFRYVY